MNAVRPSMQSTIRMRYLQTLKDLFNVVKYNVYTFISNCMKRPKKIIKNKREVEAILTLFIFLHDVTTRCQPDTVSNFSAREVYQPSETWYTYSLLLVLAQRTSYQLCFAQLHPTTQNVSTGRVSTQLCQQMMKSSVDGVYTEWTLLYLCCLQETYEETVETPSLFTHPYADGETKHDAFKQCCILSLFFSVRTIHVRTIDLSN